MKVMRSWHDVVTGDTVRHCVDAFGNRYFELEKPSGDRYIEDAHSTAYAERRTVKAILMHSDRWEDITVM